MSLGSIMSRMGLAAYAEVALIIFFLVFIGVVWQVFKRSNAKFYKQAAEIPLRDEPVFARQTRHAGEVEQ